VMAAREAGGGEIPVIAQVTIDDFGHLPGGTSTETFTREMDSWPVDAIGLNCSVGPKATLETIERMIGITSKPLSAMPNAGVPQRVEGTPHARGRKTIFSAIPSVYFVTQ
jgi:methionine synthase / methylenetetrahydrofolate reductase(NADPH)